MLETSLLLPGLLFLAPYFYNFHPAVGGIGLVPFNTERDLKQWFLMWAMFLIILILSSATYIFITKLKKIKISEEIKALIKNNDNAIFAALLTLAVFCLIIGVEIFYVKDLFDKENPPYFRTNTIFKFYFAAWPLWVISCSYFVNAILRKIYYSPLKQGFLLLFVNGAIYLILLVMSFAYSIEAIGDFYPFLKYSDGKFISFEQILKNNQTLKFYDTNNGIDYIRKEEPDDYEIIMWLNKNVEGSKVIVEAVGDAYTFYSRMSANTGLITIVGWPTHEWQWRGNITEINSRKEEVKDIYSTTSEARFKQLIDKYDVSYIVVGGKEREQYNTMHEGLISKFCKTTFTSGNSKLYSCKL
jgi:uncharacterized membrane protein